jgi:hypothetical protein
MKRPVLYSAVLVGLVACGGPPKDADSPSNADESGDAGPAAADMAAPSDTSTPPAKPAPGDDEKQATPCAGASFPDLPSVLSQVACEVPAPPSGSDKDLKDVLEIKVVPDSPRIAPGATSTVTITFRNKGKTELPLYFTVDPEPRFAFEVYTPKGNRVDKPRGNEPALPAEVANAPQPEPKVAQIKLAPLGVATVRLPWMAVKYKWAPKDRAKGALPGHGYPRVPAGSLPKGPYILRVVTPLIGVFEGIDHEVSQPRVQVTVGNVP